MPVAFLPGITGQLYRQFAVTIVGLGADLGGQRADAEPGAVRPAAAAAAARQRRRLVVPAVQPRPRRARATATPARSAGCRAAPARGRARARRRLRRRLRALPARCRPRFLPEEDQGYFFVDVQLPDGASLRAHRGGDQQVGAAAQTTRAWRTLISVAGFSLSSAAQAPNAGASFVILKPWDEREQRAQTRQAPDRQASAASSPPSRSATIAAFNPPASPAWATPAASISSSRTRPARPRRTLAARQRAPDRRGQPGPAADRRVHHLHAPPRRRST